MRIALFSEVYWPMVSGVGVTLQRLTESLAARGHVVRVYTASYPLPAGQPDRPEVHRSPSVPLFLYPDVQWAFPRQRDIEDDLAGVVGPLPARQIVRFARSARDAIGALAKTVAASAGGLARKP